MEKLIFMKTAVITGANGFVGARLVLELLHRGHHVYALGRSKGRRSWRDRVCATLNDASQGDFAKTMRGSLTCISADVCKPGLGLERAFLKPSRKRNVILFHAVGDTRFNPDNLSSQRLVNVEASLHVVNSFYGVLSNVVYLSTAYVCGVRKGDVFESDCIDGQMCRNAYEKSKVEAEIALKERCKNLAIPLTIIRPSIVINDASTGFSSAMTHLNAVLETVTRIQKKAGNRGEQSKRELFRVPIHPDRNPNMVSVDVVGKATVDLGLIERARGKTIHLCHPAPQSNRELVSLLAKALGVHRCVAPRCVLEDFQNLTRGEKLLFRTLGMYLPYLNNAPVFDVTQGRDLLPDYDLRFTPITTDYLNKIVRAQNFS